AQRRSLWDVRSMEWLGLANSGTTCAHTRPITERVFWPPHGPTAPHHDALPATRSCTDGASMAEPEDNNATHSGPTDAHARPAPPGGGAPAATRLDAALVEDVASIANNRR